MDLAKAQTSEDSSACTIDRTLQNWLENYIELRVNTSNMLETNFLPLKCKVEHLQQMIMELKDFARKDESGEPLSSRPGCKGDHKRKRHVFDSEGTTVTYRDKKEVERLIVVFFELLDVVNFPELQQHITIVGDLQGGLERLINNHYHRRFIKGVKTLVRCLYKNTHNLLKALTKALPIMRANHRALSVLIRGFSNPSNKFILYLPYYRPVGNFYKDRVEILNISEQILRQLSDMDTRMQLIMDKTENLYLESIKNPTFPDHDHNGQESPVAAMGLGHPKFI